MILGDTVAETGSSERDRVSLLETNLDDMNPELFSDVMEQCFAGGALDVWLTPIQMKKNRPGTQLSVLCQNRDTQTLAELILSHTTTFGVRINELHREILTRELVTVSTRFGEVRLKVGRRHGKSIRCSPEYESCRQLAASANVSVAEVFTAAHQAAAQMEVS